MSVPRVCNPVFILAILLTALCCWINIEVAPWAEQKITRTLTEIVTSNPAALFRGDEVVDQFPDRRIYVGAKEGDVLKNLIMIDLNDVNEPLKMVHAKEGVIRPDPENTRLLIHLKDARFEQRDEKNPRDISKILAGLVASRKVCSRSSRPVLQGASGRLPSQFLPPLPELLQFIKDGANGKLLGSAGRTQQALLGVSWPVSPLRSSPCRSASPRTARRPRWASA